MVGLQPGGSKTPSLPFSICSYFCNHLATRYTGMPATARLSTGVSCVPHISRASLCTEHCTQCFIVAHLCAGLNFKHLKYSTSGEGSQHSCCCSPTAPTRQQAAASYLCCLGCTASSCTDLDRVWHHMCSSVPEPEPDGTAEPTGVSYTYLSSWCAHVISLVSWLRPVTFVLFFFCACTGCAAAECKMSPGYGIRCTHLYLY